MILPKLLILSDLHGLDAAYWLSEYVNRLSNYCELLIYDSNILAETPKEIQSVHDVHLKFVNGGIEKAAQNLMKKNAELNNILGFSIGGCIAWKAALLGLKVNNLFAISSTRIRYETRKPISNCHLFFGGGDNYRPSKEWCDTMELQPSILYNENHNFYMKFNYAQYISEFILEHVNTTV